MPIVSLTSGKSFQFSEGSTILESSNRSMVPLPYSCKVGRCSACKCKVLSGATTPLNAELGLSEKEIDEGWILSCVRAANSDVVLQVEDLEGVGLLHSKTYPCRISHIKKLSTDVMMVKLRLPPNTNFDFMPGQYIEIIGKDGIRRSYSLANESFLDKQLELHIRRVSGGIMSDYWFKSAKVNDLLRINGPLGTFFLRPSVSDRDLILLATGTGFAPIKAMLETLAKSQLQIRPKSITAYWGGRNIDDFYLDVKNLQKKFNLIPVLSRPNAEWTGAKGYVQHTALSMIKDLSNSTVYACGSDEMIRSAKVDFTKAGLNEEFFYSDAFVCSAVN